MVLVLLVSIAFSPEALPRIPLCSFRLLTGLDCPGCGLTRAFCAISHGRLGDAWRYNPFGYLFYGVTLALVAYPWLKRYCPGLVERVRQFRWLKWLPAGLLVALSVFGFLRILAAN
jgi:hypothetical protein